MAKRENSRKKLTRQELRDLDIEIGFIEAVVKRDPQYVDALQILGDDYTRRGRFNDGLTVDEQLARLRPNDALVRYNLACSFALNEQLNSAVSALDQALKLGFRYFKWLIEDPDLANLHDHPGFKKLRNRIRTIQIKVR